MTGNLRRFEFSNNLNFFRPLSFVDGSAFKGLMQYIEPNLKNYGRKAISSLIKSQYDEKVLYQDIFCVHILCLYVPAHLNIKVAEIRNELNLCEPGSISITVDGWVSQSNDGYLTVTAHFINKKWNLVDLNLSTCGFEDRHTGENIKEAIKEVCNRNHSRYITY